MASGEVHSGRNIFGSFDGAMGKILAQLEAQTHLIVGAGTGDSIAGLLTSDPMSKIVAFEPFPGNWPVLENRFGADPRVHLRCEAIGETVGTALFYTPELVRLSQTGKWADSPAVSFDGCIVEPQDERARNAIMVQTLALDSLMGEHYRLAKIDVGGGELKVLAGAHRMLASGGIDMLEVSFRGEVETLKLLAECGYALYECTYRMPARAGVNLSSWEPVDATRESSGATLEAWTIDAPSSIEAYGAWFLEQSSACASLTGDIVAVHVGFLPQFLRAAGRAIEAEDTKRRQVFMRNRVSRSPSTGRQMAREAAAVRAA